MLCWSILRRSAVARLVKARWATYLIRSFLVSLNKRSDDTEYNLLAGRSIPLEKNDSRHSPQAFPKRLQWQTFGLLFIIIVIIHTIVQSYLRWSRKIARAFRPAKKKNEIISCELRDLPRLANGITLNTFSHPYVDTTDLKRKKKKTHIKTVYIFFN